MSFFPTRHIALQAGPLAIHWYGLMYLLAFLLAWWLVPKLAKVRGLPLSQEQRSSLVLYGVMGTLLGGRLGYVLFYGAEYYGRHPLEILAVWKGGMSSHGGFLGVALALWLLCRKHALNIWKLADVIVVPAALGLALGRMGNFINQELYGPVTMLPWGIAIPGVEGLRHPTQLYAVLKDLTIAGACFLQLRMTSDKRLALCGESRSGVTTALFLISYGILRFLIEYLRIETAEGLNLGFVYLTRGQVLTIPLVVLGTYLLWARVKNSA